ncbi:MAG TPA: glycosyltransferase, partial [Gemmatimonadales bacterium]|nr:glycosyltransferase [Gemmatimonadales bacterium]
PDLIADGETGLLVDPLEPRAWAEALARLVEDATLARRLGDAGRRLVRSEFTVARTAERTEAVYRDAMARRASLR